jgi:nucleoside-diphosphate-sugar epimerase
MSHNILITGASGYLGGTILARWERARLPPYQKLYALVRSEEQGEAVKKYGAKPIFFDIKDEASIRTAIIENQITVVYYLIDAMTSVSQIPMIKALAEVKKKIGKDVHFLHTSGAKIFSNHAGLPTDRPILDKDPELYGLQNNSVAKYIPVQMVCSIQNFSLILADAE